MPQGERGPHSSRRGKDEASDEHRRDRDGRKMFSQVTQVTGKHCSPGPWMGLSRHSCQRVLERQELKQHCTCLPRPSLPSLCSRPPPPTTLWVSGTFDTPTTFLGGPQGSPSSFLTYISPSPVLLTPYHLCQTLILPWCPCSHQLKVLSSSSTAQSTSDIASEKPWSQQWAPVGGDHVSCSTAACSRSFCADISFCNRPKGITRLHNAQRSCTYRPKASQQDKSFSLLNLPHR